MTLPTAQGAVASSEPPAPAGRPRVLFLDPIGHLLGHHDHAICDNLARLGCDVVLGANEFYGPAGEPSGYRRQRLYRGVVGDGNRLLKVVNYVRSARRIVREARRLGVDAVVLYFALQAALDVRLVRRLNRLGLRTVVCAHDVLPLRSGRDRLGSWRRLYHAADRVLTFGGYGKRELVESLGYPPERAAVAYLGVDRAADDAILSTAEARHRLDLPREEQVLLCLGMIRPTKGLDDLIRAFPDVLRSHPRARLWILGRPLRVDVEPYARLIRELDLEERVVFRPGHVPQEEVPVWLQAADVVVHPDTRIYQSGIVAQANALGRPIVATEAGNVTEVIRDGETGWLVPVRDPGALGRALSDALSDPEEAGRRGRRAREETLRRCTWPALAGTLKELLG